MMGFFFKFPIYLVTNDFIIDNFDQESDTGEFSINMGNSCATIYLLQLKDALANISGSEQQ